MNRLVLLLIAAFWAAMNVLLWRSEYGGDDALASKLPVSAVWEKILTAPDDSPLEISWKGEKIGYCRWIANIGQEEATGKTAAEEAAPEGQVKNLSGYTVDLEGSLMARDLGGRLRFELHGAFSTNNLWQTLTAKLLLRPLTWEVKARAGQRTLEYTLDTGGGKQTQTLGFDQLSNPAQLIQMLGVPLPAVPLLPLLSSTNAAAPANSLALGLDWEARSDWLKVGHSRVRVYRLEARLLDKHRVVVIVSRVGEILRVELPNEITLVNDALINL